MPVNREMIMPLTADHNGVCKVGQTPRDQANFKLVKSDISDLYENEVDATRKDLFINQTPLSYTAESGHDNLDKLLIETGKVDINMKDRFSHRTRYSFRWGTRV